MRCTRKAERIRRRSGPASAIVSAAVLAGAANLWAGIGFDNVSSTLRITQDADVTDTSDVPFIKNPSTVPPSTLIFPTNNYQLNHQIDFSYEDGTTASTLASGSLGHTTNSTTASFILATGTGVTQTDPGGHLGSSSLKFNFDLRWRVPETSTFGPLANGYASIAVGGNVGVGGSAQVIVNLRWRNAAGDDLRTQYNPPAFTYGEGPLSQVITTSRVLGNGTLPSTSLLRLSGSVEFLSNNETTPTTISPIRVEMGGAPPTAHFKIDQDGSYFDSANWVSVPEGEDGLRTIANAAGERAVFFSTTDEKVPHTVSLGSSVTLGTLDIGGTAPYSITNGDSGRIEFRTQSGLEDAVLNTRGQAFAHNILVPIEVPQGLELDADQGINFGDTINGTGSIKKFGRGRANFAASNANFAGDISVFDGIVRGGAFRSLGLGKVVIDGGQVDYEVGGASANPVVVKRGLINVDAVAEGDHFEVQQGGAIGGNPATVSSLHVGQELLLRSGAMIVHGDPENVQNGNPQGLGNDPLYVFGVAGGLPVGEMAIGTASGTPWVGIGGSRGDNSFGSSQGLITIQGAAVVASLPGGSLNVESRLIGTTDGTLTKMGDGSVRLLNSNPFAGPTSVNEGALVVNGSLGGDVTVKSGGTLGGRGVLVGLLQASEAGGTVAPGDGGVGTLSVGKLQLGDQTSLNFDLDSPSNSDKILIAGDLVLDGELFIEAGDNFGVGKYPLMHFNGSLTDNGLKVAFAPEGVNAEILIEPDQIILLGLKNTQGQASNGGTVFLVVVPEPSTMALAGAALGLMLRRRRR